MRKRLICIILTVLVLAAALALVWWHQAADSFTFLCIGNSITEHVPCDYWWGDWGMAASRPELDYVHRLEALLGDNVKGDSINLSVWEMLFHDRVQTLSLLEGRLDPKLDLIVVQLGENVTDTETLEEDFCSLLRYLQNACPEAELVVVGNFWADDAVESAKKQASRTCGVSFISLEAVQAYTCGIGTQILGADGQWHTVEHKGVALHPGDTAMAYIAEQIVMALPDPQK